MLNGLLSLTLVVGMLLAFSAQAKVDTRTFSSPQVEKDYNDLVNELRCLVCQNQNLAGSNAELAIDLRERVYEMLEQGASREEVVDFMVKRYGDFVLYRPPLKSTTLFLWFGPLILIVIGGVIVVAYMRRQKKQPVEDIPEQQQQRAHSLLDDE